MRVYVWTSGTSMDRVEFEPQADDYAFVVMRVKARDENEQEQDVAIVLDEDEAADLTTQLIAARLQAEQACRAEASS